MFWKFDFTTDVAAPTILFNLDENTQEALKTVAFWNTSDCMLLDM